MNIFGLFSSNKKEKKVENKNKRIRFRTIRPLVYNYRRVKF